MGERREGGFDPVENLPGVGENLQDHVVGVRHRIRVQRQDAGSARAGLRGVNSIP